MIQIHLPWVTFHAKNLVERKKSSLNNRNRLLIFMRKFGKLYERTVATDKKLDVILSFKKGW